RPPRKTVKVNRTFGCSLQVEEPEAVAAREGFRKAQMYLASFITIRVFAFLSFVVYCSPPIFESMSKYLFAWLRLVLAWDTPILSNMSVGGVSVLDVSVTAVDLVLLVCYLRTPGAPVKQGRRA
ncbi:hypothetical protein HDU67_008298, partial [Dinochytrium kinnereticum]